MRLAGFDDGVDCRAVRVLDVDVVDPTRPLMRQARRVATADVEVTGLKANADVAQLHRGFDLPGCLDVGARLGVQSRLVAAVATARHNRTQPLAEAGPALRVEAEGAVG